MWYGYHHLTRFQILPEWQIPEDESLKICLVTLIPYLPPFLAVRSWRS